jgi:hypothetical protein
MDAQDILARVVEVYGRCETYRDEIVHTERFDTKTPITSVKKCSTRFIRGVGFRFDLKKYNKESVQSHLTIWKEGDDAYRWGDIEPVKTAGGLASHLKAAAGISSGMSMQVPTMLLVEGFAPRKWNAARVLDVRPDDPAGLVRIEYETFLACEVLTIDLATMLIVRCEDFDTIEPLSESLIERARSISPRAVEVVKERLGGRGPGKLVDVHGVTEYRSAVNVEVLQEETRFTPDA